MYNWLKPVLHTMDRTVVCLFDKFVEGDWEGADAFARGVIDGVGDGGCDADEAEFADAFDTDGIHD